MDFFGVAVFYICSCFAVLVFLWFIRVLPFSASANQKKILFTLQQATIAITTANIIKK